MRNETAKHKSRPENTRLTNPQRNQLMRELKTKALQGDMQSVLAIGMFEMTEAMKILHNSGVRM